MLRSTICLICEGWWSVSAVIIEFRLIDARGADCLSVSMIFRYLGGLHRRQIEELSRMERVETTSIAV
jgi:hypothetical protein